MFSSRENRCHRFQANIFNKSKCQNCFKTVDSHKLSEADLYQTKPVQVGWLLLAPEGTDFNNPGHKKRKWQRRYFVLYEHGLLSYSLDEMPGTLPQGSVNMTQCCEVEDAFTQTGFQNCLRLCFTDRDYFIRTENTNSISRRRRVMSRKQKKESESKCLWQENLIVYPKASKSNQRKRRKDTSHPQPAPAQQSEDNQTSSGSTSTNNFNSSSAKKNSSGNSVNSSSIIRRSSLNSGNNNAGRVSSAISDLSRDASTSNSSITKTSADTVSSGRISSVSSKEGSGKGSVVSTVEGVSLLSSETGPEEESLCGGVEVSSSGGHAPSCNIAPDSSHSSSVSQAQDGSSTEGIRNRLGIESGYSSLEKTSPVVGDVPSHVDSRCASASQPYMFSGSKSLGSSRIPLPTYRNFRRACGDDPEDVASCSWEMKDLESDGERKYGHQTHTSMTHKGTQVGTQILNRDTHQAHSLGGEVHRLFGNRRRRSQDVGQLENVFLSPNADFPPSTSSCTAQNNHKATDFSLIDDIPDLPRPSASCSLRSKSLERRQADPTPTPDLLNFKKGWMSRLGEDGKWHKHWFVLTDQTLRFYRDCVAEEAADVDGEINLSTCFDVTDYPVQRNYGFQIHTKDGVFTLCAMTYGIRRNWVQAVMKNVRPTVAPDVTWKHSPIKSSSVPQKVPLIGAHPRTSSSQYNTLPQEEEKRSRTRERRREGRYKTFDWAELSCKQQKEEGSNGPSGREWDRNCRRSVPPAPASTPEEPITFSISNTLEKEYPPKSRLCQNPSLNIPSNLSLTGASSLTSPESISPDSLEVDAGGARIHCDSSSELQRAQAKKNKQVDRSTSPLPVTFCSSLAQTEWHWEVELQSLRRELRAEHERSQVQERESKLSQARLQAELKDSQDRLQKAELRIQEAETLLKERDDVLESLRGRLEEVTGRLKATEEAQALKEVRLQRHLRLLQESQERERRSFSDSLDQSEQRLKELEECLRQKEAELQKRSAGEVSDDLIQRCQELQNQLEESDSEVGRLQARLQTEETQYYDMEHDYERACEEIQSLQGALQDCERECAERFEAQLERQQQELDRKERELQEVLVKMAVLGSSLEETERKLKQAQNNLLEAKVNGDTLTESHHLFRVSNIRRKMKGIGQSGSEIPTQADESDRVISVIQALERKLCDTEERLRELTIHLQQQQQLSAGPHTLNGVNDSWCAHSSPRNVELSIDALQSCSGALHRFQEKTLDRTSDKAKVCNYDNGNIGGKWLVGEIPEMHLDVASSVLSLEALIIQRMASALQHPSTDLLNRLSEMHGQVLKMAQGRSYNGTMESTYSQIFLHPLEQDQIDKTLSETEIHRLCVRAEMAYLIHTFHTCSSPEQQDSEVIHVSPWPVLDSSSTSTKKENGLKQRPELADISPPELAPYSEQIEDGLTDDLLFEDSEEQHTCRQNLVEELRAQAQALQDLSTHLQSDVREADLLGELPPVVLRVAMCQATLGYMACRLRSTLQQEVTALRKQKEQAECECRAVCRSMDALFQEQTERYEEKLREERVVIEKAEQGRVSAETNAQLRVEEAERLQVEFEEKLHELQKIHEEEMSHLHEYYIQNLPTPKDVEVEGDGETEWVSVTALQERIRELKTEITCLREELKNQDDDALRRDFQIDLENIKATYEHGFSIMEESHQRVIEEMQKQHQREVERLTEERERVLQEETNATIAAIEAMRKAHKEEMDKSQKALQNGTSVDISQLRAQYNEELESLHRELEVLSEQYSQKCLENTHLTRTIEVERETLRSTHRENQELRTHNQELNECLAAELSLMHSRMNGEAKHSLSSQEKDVYQLEVNLRVKESEIKCLKQKISSLKLELHATNTSFKDFHSELSVLGVQTQNDFNKLRMEAARQQGSRYDLMKSKSNPDFLKDRSALSQPNRSKSLKDGLTVQERMKLFESSPTQTI